ncbi:hypothetical protein NDU88_005973 [Pleurodeles waltl]|uniref:Uncharacterized protein n=1 Tax=Pleurodeles waltl TaxID=8319 RepID=A0AAV7MY84_PLEWA|nr:hypothetical protein NDU88_005973 [Pleurodeles waltl]
MQESEHYSYLRLGHALRRHLQEGEQIRDMTLLEDRVLTEPLTEQPILTIYKKLVNNSPDPNGRLRVAWEEGVGTMDDDDWVDALKSAREIAIQTLFRLLQLWIVHRSYLSRGQLQRMGHSTSDMCVWLQDDR